MGWWGHRAKLDWTGLGMLGAADLPRNRLPSSQTLHHPTLASQPPPNHSCNESHSTHNYQQMDLLTLGQYWKDKYLLCFLSCNWRQGDTVCDFNICAWNFKSHQFNRFSITMSGYRCRILIWANLLQQDNNPAATGNVNYHVDFN